MATGHYTMYHNPDTMGYGCDEIPESGTVATNKEGVANQIAAEGNAVIWCIGRTDYEDEEDTFYLYQRIESPTVEQGEGDFSVHLVGTPTFPEGEMVDITDRAYFPKIETLLRYGVQPVSDADLITSLEAEFAQVWRKKRQK